jgi:hypothetical protein
MALEHLWAHDSDRDTIPASPLCEEIAFLACGGFPDLVFIYRDSSKTVFTTNFGLRMLG